MVVLDANILLEILEKRRLYDSVVGVLEKFAAQEVVFSISTLTVSNTFYLAERHKVPTKRVETLLNNYKMFDVLTADVDWALTHYKGKDFEDALQVAAAIRKKCTAFLTLDTSLARKYDKYLVIELVA